MPIDVAQHSWQSGAGENNSGGDAQNAGYVEAESGGVLTLGAVTIGGGFEVNPNSPGQIDGTNYNVNLNIIAAVVGGVINVGSLQIGGDFFGTGTVSGGTLNVAGNVILHGMDTGGGPPGGSLFAVPAGLNGSNVLTVGLTPWVGVLPQFVPNLPTSPAILQVGVTLPLLLGGLSPTAADGVTSKVVIGGTLTVGDDAIGGVLMIDGVGSTLTAAQVSVGILGSPGDPARGQIDVFAGGALTVDHDLTDGGGTVTADQGTVTVHGNWNGDVEEANFLNGATGTVDGSMATDTLRVAGTNTHLNVAGTLSVTGITVSDSARVDTSGFVVATDASITREGSVHAGNTLLKQGAHITITIGGLLQSQNFTYAGQVEVDNGGILKYQSGHIAPGGGITGDGALLGDIENDGTLSASPGGTLGLQGNISGSGLLSSERSVDSGGNVHLGTLDFSQMGSGTITVGTLENDGILNLGTTDVHITTSYTNFNWGSGNSFDPHANVTGTGHIIGDGAALGVTGTGVAQGAGGPVLYLVGIAGGVAQGSFTLTNDGDGAAITAALQTLGLGAGFSGITADDVTLASGQSATYTLAFDPTVGTFSGHSITILSDFDNVAPITISLSDVSYVEGADDTLSDDDGVGVAILENGTGHTLTGHTSAPSTLYSADTAGQSNTLVGGSGGDFLAGGMGADHLEGGGGNDLYVVHSSSTTISDSGGTTDVAYVEGVNFSLTDGDGIEVAILENGTGNTLTGHMTQPSTLYSVDMAGQSNTLIGGRGADLLVGGLGADHLQGGDGNDTYVVNSSGTTISDSGGSTDVVYAEGVNFALTDGDGIEYLILDGTGHTATGHATTATTIYSIGSGNTLAGGSATDVLVAGPGGDTLIGAGGNDFLVGGAGNDTFQLGTGFGQDVVYNFQPHGGSANGDTIRMTGEPAGTTFASMVAANQIFDTPDASQPSGTDVVVEHDANNYVILLNHHLADLTASDFLFG